MSEWYMKFTINFSNMYILEIHVCPSLVTILTQSHISQGSSSHTYTIDSRPSRWEILSIHC